MSVTVFTTEELEALEAKWTLPRFVFFPAGVLGIVMLSRQGVDDSWLRQVGWTLFTGYFFFCWTSCFHETAHQTLHGRRWISIWLGRLLGTLIWVPYSVYRETHIRHHAYLNKPTDWELWPYSDPNASLTFRRCFVWLDLFLGALTAPVEYGRIYFHKDSPLTNPKLRRTIFLEYIGIVLFWGTMYTWMSFIDGGWRGLINAWIIPLLLAGICQSSRKLTEHLGMSSYDPMLGTRTVLSNNWITRLSSYFNFDIFIHGPHHRHPRIADCQLGQKMRDYINENPETDYPVYPSYWRATAQILPYLFKNPGVGMNVGAAAPAAEKDDNVQNFVADVTSEVLADADVRVPLSALS